MENWQFEYINKHLKQLLKVTNCNNELLQELKSTKTLNEADLINLEKEKQQNGDIAKKTMLFAMLQTRSNGYESLHVSFHKSNCNKIAAVILEDGFKLHSKDNIFSAPQPQQPHTCIVVPPNKRPSEKQQKPVKKKSPKHKQPLRPMTKLWLSALVSMVISGFIFFYLVNYMDVDFLVAAAFASVALPLVFALQCVPFIRATFLLTTPELTSRTLRILLVQTLIALMPLQGLQTSSNTFVDSMLCTNQKAIEAATNGTGDMLRNAMTGVRTSIQAINVISDKIQNVVRAPMQGFEKTVEVFESVLRWVEGIKTTCVQATNGISDACRGILDTTSDVCDNTLGKVRVRRFLGGFANTMSNAFQNVKDTATGVGNSVGHTATNTYHQASDAATGIYNGGKQTVESSYNTATGGVRDALNTVADVCVGSRSISTNCRLVQGSGFCNGFDRINQFRRLVEDWKKEAVNTVLDQVKFRLISSQGHNTIVDKDSINNIKKDINAQMQDKLDFFQAFRTIWSLILSLSVFFIVISKAFLVRKYLKTRHIKLKPISIFFVLMNPFVLQLCFLLLIGVMHMSFFMLHDMFREATLHKEVSLGASFSASVRVEGGNLGKHIAQVLIKSFELHNSVETKLSFEDCFQTQGAPPNLMEYGIVVGISAIGVLTYGVDIFSRRRQESLIGLVYK